MPLDPIKLRTARGNRSQSEIALAAGLAQPRYCLIESGKRPGTSLSVAERIAKALRVPLKKILE